MTVVITATAAAGCSVLPKGCADLSLKASAVTASQADPSGLIFAGLARKGGKPLEGLHVQFALILPNSGAGESTLGSAVTKADGTVQLNLARLFEVQPFMREQTLQARVWELRARPEDQEKASLGAICETTARAAVVVS